MKFYNHNADLQPPPGFQDIEASPTANEFTLHNTLITATFNHLGLLKAVKVRANTIPIHLDFAKYIFLFVAVSEIVFVGFFFLKVWGATYY